MVKTMEIECPSCSHNFKLFLSVDTSMIILDCPICNISIIYYKNQTYPLSKQQIDRIKKCKNESNVIKILHNITAQESKVHCIEPAHQLQMACSSENSAISQSFHILKSDVDRITYDDLINLRIELETCKDVRSFIDRI
jgi:hypothetical protein